MTLIKSFAAVALAASSVSLAVAAAPTMLGCHHTSKQNVQCQYRANVGGKKTMLYAQSAMPYALCSKALCHVDPHHKNMSVCHCDVFTKGWQGASVGPKSYRAGKPTYHGKKLMTVTSNFSMANLSSTSEKPVSCSNKVAHPWANCFGIRCQVSEHNGHLTATCRCPVAKSKTFISVGPKNEGQCDKGYSHGMIWSAALASQGQSNGVIIPYMYKTYFGK